MKHIVLSVIASSLLIFLLFSDDEPRSASNDTVLKEKEPADMITGFVQPGDTLETIFKRHHLEQIELIDIYRSAKKICDLSKISVGDMYSFTLDMEQDQILSMKYEIDDLSYLRVIRSEEGFIAEKVDLPVIKKIGSFYIKIRDNLIYSMPDSNKEYMRLALNLSDIYAWDIDFSSDIRVDASVKMIVEELWLGEIFKGYGNILAAQITNNGKIYNAYRFEHNGNIDYYDSNGKSLRKALLKSPLKFKYISSRFSRRRYHPILRIHRPHLGVDYAAPAGTPVSASGSGTVMFAGRKGQNGKMVKIKHNNGYTTYYGHLSKIAGNIRKGSKVSQGEIIGYVGSTGLSTGPHLDYRIKYNGKFVDPLRLKLPRGKSIPKKRMAEFRRTINSVDSRFVSLTQPIIALKDGQYDESDGIL